MQLTKKVTIDAPIAKVWDILGPNYQDAGKWASSVYISAPRAGTPKVADAPVAGRVCQTSLGPFTESIEAYSDQNHHVSYSATGDKMPGFMKGLRNSWTLREIGPNKTETLMQLNADIAFPFNVMMGWMMKMQFNKALSETIDDLKYYAENDKPHPRKTKIDASKKATAARHAMA